MRYLVPERAKMVKLLDAVWLRFLDDPHAGKALNGGDNSSIAAGTIDYLIKRSVRAENDMKTKRRSCFAVAFDRSKG